MEALVIGVVVVLAAAGVFWWTRRRARPSQAGDASGAPRTRAEPRRLVPPPAPQVLDRNTVLGRNRAFDPNKWDNTPDGSEEDGAGEPEEEPADEDLPRFFDREYLERKSRGEAPEA
jgi:hypothetical protein